MTRTCDSDDWDVQADPAYELVRVLTSVDLIEVDRAALPKRQLQFLFVRYDTTPETDVLLSVECEHADPGVHVVGEVPYVFSAWPYERNNTSPATMTFARPITAKVFVHADRTKEIVITIEEVYSMSDEKILEKRLCSLLARGQSDVSVLAAIPIVGSTSAAKTLADLIRHPDYTIIEDSNQWNTSPKLGLDLFGNLTVDIVIRSRRAQDACGNRMIIEVKDKDDLHYGIPDSQIVRYLLHLLVTSVEKADLIGRAVLLAAPAAWFAREQARGDRSKWRYFLEHYTGLAQSFDVTLGAIVTDTLPSLS